MLNANLVYALFGFFGLVAAVVAAIGMWKFWEKNRNALGTELQLALEQNRVLCEPGLCRDHGIVCVIAIKKRKTIKVLQMNIIRGAAKAFERRTGRRIKIDGNIEEYCFHVSVL